MLEDSRAKVWAISIIQIQSLALTRDANLDTQSSDISAEEIRQGGHSCPVVVCEKKLSLFASLLAEDI